MSDEKQRKITSRGIPSKESFYLPAHYSNEIRKFQDESEIVLRNYWNLDELLNFVFPHKYQPVYNEISIKFMNELIKKSKLSAGEITEFVKKNEISKATFYNRVLPRLKRVGMIKVERQTIIAEHNKQKYRPMEISLSKSFGNYLSKIGDSWLALVDDVRTRKSK